MVVGIGFAQVPSDQSKISLLTCAPGDMPQDAWGHNAIRFYDPVNGIDKVYNYGTYDFDAPNFLLNFLKGKLDYNLSTAPYRNFLYVYNHFERSVYEQPLNLTAGEMRSVHTFLSNNELPENKGYLYDFFYDNCSTRIRDLCDDVLPSLQFLEIEQEDISFRQLLDTGLKNKKWTDFGIDLILGATTDALADYRAAMFLPFYLKEYLQSANFSRDGKQVSLIDQTNLVLDHDQAEELRNKNSWFTPLLVFSILALLELILLITYKDASPKWLRAYDYLWIIILAIASMIMLMMWFATDHVPCSQNWNLLWASPLYIPMLYFFWKRNSKVYYFLAFGIFACSAAAIIGWWIIPQQYHIAFIPILLMILLKWMRL